MNSYIFEFNKNLQLHSNIFNTNKNDKTALSITTARPTIGDLFRVYHMTDDDDDDYDDDVSSPSFLYNTE